MPNKDPKSGKCAKQETIAIIENNGRYWIGSNWCLDSQEQCPRAGMKTGEGYELCRKICVQVGHAEEQACSYAGPHAIGSTLYLIGHTYCCDKCTEIMKKFGVAKVVIGRAPWDEQ